MLPNIEVVDSIISDLKNGKAASLYELTAKNFKFNHRALARVVNLLSLMLKYGIVSAEVGDTYTVPIPKAKQNFGKALLIHHFIGISISFEGISNTVFSTALTL